MPPHSDDAVSNSEKLVHLDYDSTEFDVLLALINKTRKPTSYGWTELSILLEIGGRYHFTHIPDLVHQPASYCLNGGNATDIYQFASINGSPDLARYSIVKFADSEFKYQDPMRITPFFYD